MFFFQCIDFSKIEQQEREIIVKASEFGGMADVMSIGTSKRPCFSGVTDDGYVRALERHTMTRLEIAPLLQHVDVLYETLNGQTITITKLDNARISAEHRLRMLKVEANEKASLQKEIDRLTYANKSICAAYEKTRADFWSEQNKLAFKTEEANCLAAELEASRKRERELRDEGDRDVGLIKRLTFKVNKLERQICDQAFPDFIVMDNGVDSDWQMSASAEYMLGSAK